MDIKKESTTVLRKKLDNLYQQEKSSLISKIVEIELEIESRCNR